MAADGGVDDRLAEQIALNRKSAGMSQGELGQQVGLSRVTVTQIEAGKRKVTADELLAFAEALGLPVGQLVDPSSRPQVIWEKDQTAPVGEQGGLRISVPQKNVRKFKEVLLYLLTRVGGKPNVGETVLYKLLYFTDFDYYEKYEEQLVGATYVKADFGPLPVEFQEIVREMIETGDLQMCSAEYFGKRQKRYLALREPDLSALDGREVRTIEEVIGRLSDMNGSQIAEYSHKDVPWLAAADGQVIDYESVFYRTPDYSVRPEVA